MTGNDLQMKKHYYPCATGRPHVGAGRRLDYTSSWSLVKMISGMMKPMPMLKSV
jgi:hypothetical protein